MTQENYPSSVLLSIDYITEDDLLHIPDLLAEESKTPFMKTFLTNEPTSLTITHKYKPTTLLNSRSEKKKSIILSGQLF